MTDPRYTPLAKSLPDTVPFVGPETQERAMGHAFLARLGANENLFGPSPQAIRAMQSCAAASWAYGDPENFDLRTALAAHHGIDPANIVVGEGIDGLLGYLARLLIAPGDPVVTSDGAYPTFNFHVTGYGGQLYKVPYQGNHEDPVALVAKAAQVNAKLVYLANPDNPMGSWHSADTITQMVNALPQGCLLALDEAYIEFAPQGSALPIDVNDTRVIRFRTFSKAYGLAGARVGYALGHAKLIKAFDKIRNHFGMSRISQAGALAALHDTEWLDQTRNTVEAARQKISQIARHNGLTPLPSATNFVTIDCGSDGGFARQVVAELAARDVFIRMPFVAPHDRCIRVSCGPDAVLDIFAHALPEALHAARNPAE